MGGMPEGDVVLCPSITLNGGTLILKEGAVLAERLAGAGWQGTCGLIRPRERPL